MRYAGELERLALGERIANLNRAVIMQSNDITGLGLIQRDPLASLKTKRIGDPNLFAGAHVF